MKIGTSLIELSLSSSWPPRRDSRHYDADWLLFIVDAWRVALKGIPSVFT